MIRIIRKKTLTPKRNLLSQRLYTSIPNNNNNNSTCPHNKDSNKEALNITKDIKEAININNPFINIDLPKALDNEEFDKLIKEKIILNSQNQLEPLPITKELWYQCFYSIKSSFSAPLNKKIGMSNESMFQDALLLACIYPGSTEFINKLVKNLALETGANLLNLDIYDLAHLAYTKSNVFSFPNSSIDELLPLYYNAENLQQTEIDEGELEELEFSMNDLDFKGTKKRLLNISVGIKKILNKINDLNFLKKNFQMEKNSPWIIHFYDLYELLYHPFGQIWINALYSSIQNYNLNNQNKIILICSLNPSYLVNYHFQNNQQSLLELSTQITNCIHSQTEKFMSNLSSSWANSFTILNIYPNLLPQESKINSNWSNYKSTHNITPEINELKYIKNGIEIENWMKQLNFGIKKRVLEINIKNLSLICLQRNCKLELPSEELIKISYNTLPYSLNRLTKVIWPKEHLKKLVSTGLGVTNSNGEILELKWKYLLHALQFVTEPTHLPDSVIKATYKNQSNYPVNHIENDENKMNLEQKRVKVNKSECDNYEKKLLNCIVNPDQIKLGFEDICLSKSIIIALQNLITLPLVRPQWFKTGVLKDHFITGVLLFGPPGTGKTLLAKAVAKESGSSVLEIKGSDVYDKYVGEGEKNVKAIFSLARKMKPCVIFIDEVDALFGSRKMDSIGSSGKREIINQFMAEWDGLSSDLNQDIIVLAATNRPFDLDDAILRRLPRRLLIDLPNEEARKQILDLHLRDEKMDSSVSLNELATLAKNYSGSDIRNLCVAAALNCIREMYDEEAGNQNLIKLSNEINRDHKERKLTFKHFEMALKQVGSSISDSMTSLIELRKWDELFGDRGQSSSKRQTINIGFDVSDKKEELVQVQSMKKE